MATLPYIYDYPPTLVPPHGAWTWWEADYLLAGIKSESIPALVTTGPPSSVGPSGAPGTPGRPGTAVVLGGDRPDLGPFSGGKFVFGAWLNDSQWFGIEGGAFFLLQQQVSSTVASNGSTPLSIPFFNAISGVPDAVSIAAPVAPVPFGAVANLSLQTQLLGLESNFVFNLCNTPERRLDLLAGFRWVRIDDTLEFLTDSSYGPTGPPVYFATTDRFQVHNNFYGAQIGARGMWCWNGWTLHLTGKLAFGDDQQTSRIYGGTATNLFTGYGPAYVYPGGYLTSPYTNEGAWRRQPFAVLPELHRQDRLFLRQLVPGLHRL